MFQGFPVLYGHLGRGRGLLPWARPQSRWCRHVCTLHSGGHTPGTWDNTNRVTIRDTRDTDFIGTKFTRFWHSRANFWSIKLLLWEGSRFSPLHIHTIFDAGRSMAPILFLISYQQKLFLYLNVSVLYKPQDMCCIPLHHFLPGEPRWAIHGSFLLFLLKIIMFQLSFL